jgi:hypothetical protein
MDLDINNNLLFNNFATLKKRSSGDQNPLKKRDEITKAMWLKQKNYCTMKKLFVTQSKIIRNSKLIAFLLFETMLIYSCSGKEGNTGTNNSVGSNSNGVVGAIFWAPRVEIAGTIYNPEYYFFYREDSCFIIYGGTTSGFIKAYTKNEKSITIRLGGANGDLKYQLLGNQVLMNNGRSFFRVDNFSSAFQGNR